LRIFNLSKVIKFLQILFGYLKLTSATPGLSKPCKLRFKSNIAGKFVTDIYRFVGEYQNKVKLKFSTFSRQHFSCTGKIMAGPILKPLPEMI